MELPHVFFVAKTLQFTLLPTQEYKTACQTWAGPAFDPSMVKRNREEGRAYTVLLLNTVTVLYSRQTYVTLG